MEYTAEYERINWEDYSSTNTPINATNLNNMDSTIKKHDDAIEELAQSGGGGGGVSTYAELPDKPSINNVTLSGNKSLSDLGIASLSDIPTELADLGTDSTHRVVTDSEKETWNAKASQSSVDELANIVGSANTLLEGV